MNIFLVKKRLYTFNKIIQTSFLSFCYLPVNQNISSILLLWKYIGFICSD